MSSHIFHKPAKCAQTLSEADAKSVGDLEPTRDSIK